MAVLQRPMVDWGFTSFIESAHREGLLYDIPILKSPANATIHLEQREFVNFAGINFLLDSSRSQRSSPIL